MVARSSAIFQFTPLREGRPSRRSIGSFIFLFQFTPLREGRHAGLLAVGRAGVISIHAPPRGATDGLIVHSLFEDGISIHAPPRGATFWQDHDNVLDDLFQFTPLREGRRVVRSDVLDRSNFNSRPSARGDARAPARQAACTLFQFTPLREGRPGATQCVAAADKFQFTPLREGRRAKLR